MKNIWIILLSISFVAGCSILGNTSKDVSLEEREKYWQKYENNVEKKKVEIKFFIGKSKNVLLNSYGKPSEVDYDVGKYDNWTKKSKRYDEQWIYTFRRGARFINENSYDIIFYINDGIVEEYKIFGVPF